MNEKMIPSKVFLTKGVGRHKDMLQSFELALRDADIEVCNLVNVSSILPPNCRIISRRAGIKHVKPGQITFVVMSRSQTNEPGRLAAASVGLAIPKDRSKYGYISEHHTFGQNAKEAGEYAEDMAATMLASTLGINFDPDEKWDTRKQMYKMSGKFVRATHITQTAEGDAKGMWTTVLAIAVFIM